MADGINQKAAPAPGDPGLRGRRVALLGFGRSNQAALAFVRQHDPARIRIYDTRKSLPQGITAPADLELRLGALPDDGFSDEEVLIVSPGLSAYLPEIERARARGAEIVGDVELFARVVQKPVIGVTGSNGKSTVCAMCAAMAAGAGRKVALGANFGTPVLELLREDADIYVLELSSFELETTSSLKLKAASILNVTPDHLDRYGGSLERYAEAKRRIYLNCRQCVINRADARTKPENSADIATSFGLDEKDYGCIHAGGRTFLSVGGRALMERGELLVPGDFNVENALAALALCTLSGIPEEACTAALRTYTALPHRLALIATIREVSYYNDSKATNLGSALAALDALKNRHPLGIWLLAGGQDKGQDLSPLLHAHDDGVLSGICCFGQDGRKLAALNPQLCEYFPDLKTALNSAALKARPGQAVLLSPACASFDQFSGFEERGRVFTALVHELQNL